MPRTQLREFLWLWLALLAHVAVECRAPGYWHSADLPYPYPWGHFLQVSAWVTLDCAALLLLLGPRPAEKGAGRAALALLVGLAGYAALVARSVTDQPGWYYAHESAVGLLCLGLLAALLRRLWWLARRPRAESAAVP